MKKYFVNIVDDETENYPINHLDSLTISRKQYTELLCILSEHKIIDEILGNQSFSCGLCRSFSLPAKSLYSTLKKIERDDDTAEALSCALLMNTDIEPWYFEMLEQPIEIIEKNFVDAADFYEIQDSLRYDEFIIEEEEVYRFPFEECVFVFDARCSCSRIFHS